MFWGGKILQLTLILSIWNDNFESMNQTLTQKDILKLIKNWLILEDLLWRQSFHKEILYLIYSKLLNQVQIWSRPTHVPLGHLFDSLLFQCIRHIVERILVRYVIYSLQDTRLQYKYDEIYQQSLTMLMQAITNANICIDLPQLTLLRNGTNVYFVDLHLNIKMNKNK